MATATCTYFRPHVVNQSEGARDDSCSHWGDLRREDASADAMVPCSPHTILCKILLRFHHLCALFYSILFLSLSSIRRSVLARCLLWPTGMFALALPLFPSSVLVQKPRQEVSSSGFPISIELNWNSVD